MWAYGGVGAAPVRIGFGLDLVGYSARSAVAKTDAQARIRELVSSLVAESGADPADVDRQDSGDGVLVFFPPTVELRRVLSALTVSAARWLAHDNLRYSDRLRCRLAVVVGPVTVTAMGFGGNTAVECGRLLDSQVLREALSGHPDRDLAVLLSDVVHTFVVEEDYPEIDATRFVRVGAQAKDFSRPAWLWLPPGPAGAAPTATVRERLDADLARLRVVTTVDHERLFGIDDELDALKTYLANRNGDWAISVWGPPGVGKTALAYELVLQHARAAGFQRVAAVSAKFSRLEAGGTVDLDRVRLAIDWRDLLVEVARQLGAAVDMTPASIEDQLPTAMPDVPCLILIDNLETVPQAQVAVRFLTGSDILGPHKVVLTTRTAVGPGAARPVRERHWTGPDRPAALEYARYLARDDPSLDPSPDDLDDVVNAAERTPLLIRLIIQQAVFQRLPVRDVIARLRQVGGTLGAAVWQYLYADSLDALADHVGLDAAASLMSVFCAKVSGSSFGRDELYTLSEIADRDLFDEAVAAACRLTLMRSFAGNTQFTVHSLLREFYCGDVG